MMRNRPSFAFVLLFAGGIFCDAQSPASSSPDATVTKPETQNVPPGGVQILSDTEGVDFAPYLKQWHLITDKTWQGLMPPEVKPPTLLKGVVVIQFELLPDGQVTKMTLVGRSRSVSLDRAAWGAITASSYPSLPGEFHGPYLELRAYFLYNEQPQ
jgi:outer membrane biosynthesis protein TonB